MQSYREMVQAYAYNEAEPPPSQDHDLQLITLGLNDLLLELAADKDCQKRVEFLSCLYLLVGDAVITNGEGTTFDEINSLLVQAESYPDASIETWIKRSRHLLTHRHEFDYDLWCGGKLAGRT